MAKRSYRQYCGLAASLDVVGERWALLIVRDLVPGPRRFSDLLAGLPGLATDVLTERLRALEAAGAVEQRRVKHPVPAQLYALTERGEELAGIAGTLAQWGMPLLPPPSAAEAAGYRREPRWALQAMARRYRGGLPDGEYRFTIGDDELRVDVGDGRARVRYGHGEGAPRTHLMCSDAGFFDHIGRAAAAAAGRPLRAGARRGTVVVGSDADLDAFFAALPAPVTGPRRVASPPQ